jgi:hypothetical protein
MLSGARHNETFPGLKPQDHRRAMFSLSWRIQYWIISVPLAPGVLGRSDRDRHCQDDASSTTGGSLDI